MIKARKNSANLSIDAALIAESRALGINLSRAAAAGIADALKLEKQLRWREENADSILDYNDWIEQEGLPLAKHRQF